MININQRNVLFYTDFASFPASGATGVMYVDKQDSQIYLWNGSAYEAINSGALFLDENSTIADFQTGNTYFYIGDATITYDYDLLPYPLPIPVQNFNFVNLSVFDVVFASDSLNTVYTLKPQQALRDIKVVDIGNWQLDVTEYIDNIPNLQAVTQKGAQTFDALIVKNNPDTYRTRYSTIGQQVQYDVGGVRVDYDYIGLLVKTLVDNKNFLIQYPNISGNAINSIFTVQFRPDVSGTVAYLGDIINAILQNGNSFSAPMVIGTNDNFPLSLETNGVVRATVGAFGGLTVLLDSSSNDTLFLENINTAGTGARIHFKSNFGGVPSDLLLSSIGSGGVSEFRVTDFIASLRLHTSANGTHSLGGNLTSCVLNFTNTTTPGAQIGVNSSRKFYITDGTTVRLWVKPTNVLATDTTAYETLVIADNDIPNKKYVDSHEIRTITASDSVVTTDDTILCDATLGNITVSLPAASTLNKRVFNIKKIDASVNTITIDANGAETIDGSLTQVISAQWTCITIHSNGSNWFII